MDLNDPIESNSYAISYRLLGSRPAAYAAAQMAAERVRRRFDEEGGLDVTQVDVEHWLPMLVDFTVEASVQPQIYGDLEERPVDQAGLRQALRRRLVRASRVERVVGALVHLAGYDITDVSQMLSMDVERVRTAARILAPPPGIDYRTLGDPQLIGDTPVAQTRSIPVPRRSTVIIAAMILAVVIMALQCQGPRPTLVDEGALTVGHVTVSVGQLIN